MYKLIKCENAMIYIIIILIFAYGFYAALGRADKTANKTYAQSVEADTLFSPYVVYGTITKDLADIKMGEIVEIYYSMHEEYYIVIHKGQFKKVLWDEIIINDKKSDSIVTASDNQIEAFINNKKINSSTNYLMWTDLLRNKTYVFVGNAGEWQIIKKFDSATGDLKHPTPRGIFEITYKSKYVGKENGYLCKYAVAFFESYMYHSVLYNWDGTEIIDSRLNERISHGCIRISVENIKWIYINVPIGTSVFIN